MNQNASVENFTVVVSLLSSYQRFYTYYGVLSENGVVSLSGSHRSKNYSVTEFESESDANFAAYNFLQNRKELLKSIPNSDTANSIEIEVRCKIKNQVKVVYKIKL